MLPKTIDDVEIKVDVDATQLRWPSDDEVADEANPGMNRSYFDVRHLPWQSVPDVLAAERILVARVSGAPDNSVEINAIDEGRFLDDDDPTAGLDIGIAAAVCALSAAGCIPFSSCNGGVWNERHHAEGYPLVAFYAQTNRLDALRQAAQTAGAGLHNSFDGSLAVYADSIAKLMKFAEALHEGRGAMDPTEGSATSTP